MKQLFNLTQKAILGVKHYFAELLISFEQLPVSLVRVEYSKTLFQEVVELRIDGKLLTMSLPLQELVERSDILLHMHPLEVTLVRLLAEEECRLNGDSQPLPAWGGRMLGLSDLESFARIERQFLCPYSQRTRVVLSMPGQDQFECLNLHELANQRELMMLLKSYSSYSYQYLATHWSSEQRVVC